MDAGSGIDREGYLPRDRCDRELHGDLGRLEIPARYEQPLDAGASRGRKHGGTIANERVGLEVAV
jgi:hypothetical protein